MCFRRQNGLEAKNVIIKAVTSCSTHKIDQQETDGLNMNEKVACLAPVSFPVYPGCKLQWKMQCLQFWSAVKPMKKIARFQVTSGTNGPPCRETHQAHTNQSSDIQ